MITNEQVEAALKAWYDAGDAGNFASMYAALKAADLASVARIAELESALKPFADCKIWDGYRDDEPYYPELKTGDLRAARAAMGENDE